MLEIKMENLSIKPPNCLSTYIADDETRCLATSGIFQVKSFRLCLSANDMESPTVMSLKIAFSSLIVMSS